MYVHKYVYLIPGRGLLIAGGLKGRVLDTVEMFDLENLTSCLVTVTLDQPRLDHTGDGDLVCGGVGEYWNLLSTCYNIVNGTTINLTNGRQLHTSWSTGDGTFLIGGEQLANNHRTTELISGGSTQAGFQLRNASGSVSDPILNYNRLLNS